MLKKAKKYYDYYFDFRIVIKKYNYIIKLLKQ